MTLTPTPANEERIQYLMDSGEFATVDDVLAAALDRLAVDRIVQAIGLAEFQAQLDEGWEQAERGDTMSGEEARAYLAKARAERNRG
jgi:Arc/MetJ-type ribon-helix-helix transcriptional regulator